METADSYNNPRWEFRLGQWTEDPGGSNLKTQSQANPGSEGYSFVANGLYVQPRDESVEPFKEFGREEEDSKHPSQFSLEDVASCMEYETCEDLVRNK